MKITYKNKKIEKVCTIADEAERRYGPRMAEKIHQRIDEIDASDTVEEMVQSRIGGNEIQIVNVIEIVDYH